MQKIKSLTGAIMALALLGVLLAPTSTAFADNHGGGTTEIQANFNRYIENNEPSDNLEFSIFTNVNFVSDSAGNLIAPSEDSMRIENKSGIGVSVDAIQVTPTNGWNLVRNAEDTEDKNSINFELGPVEEMVSAYDCVDNKKVNETGAWSMTDYSGSHTTIPVLLSGKIANLDKEFVTKSQAAVVRLQMKAEWPDRVFR